MSPEEALEQMRGRPVVTVARASLASVKAMHARCLAHGVAAAMRRPSDPGG